MYNFQSKIDLKMKEHQDKMEAFKQQSVKKAEPAITMKTVLDIASRTKKNNVFQLSPTRGLDGKEVPTQELSPAKLTISERVSNFFIKLKSNGKK